MVERWLSQGLTFTQSKQFQFITPAFYTELDFKLVPLLKPDAYGYLKNPKGITHALFYILDAYTPKMMLRIKVQRIFTALDEEYWEDEYIRSLQFYVICPNHVLIIYLKRLLPTLLERYYGKAVLSFHLTTRNQIYKRNENEAASAGWINISSND